MKKYGIEYSIFKVDLKMHMIWITCWVSIVTVRGEKRGCEHVCSQEKGDGSEFVEIFHRGAEEVVL